MPTFAELYPLEILYPDKTAVELAFPIAALWDELLVVLNREVIDDAGFRNRTKGQLRAARNSNIAQARNSPIPRYDLFNRVRVDINRNMYFPLGFSSSLLKAWNIAERRVLPMYGHGRF